MIADAATHRYVLTCEDGIREGGIGFTIADQVHDITPTAQVRCLGLPSRFIQQGSAERILSQLGLDAAGLATAAHELLA